MDKLDLTLFGGMPFRNENLAYEQAGIADVIKGLVDAYGAGPFSLNGNEITPGSGVGLFNISAGFIVVNGEVHRHAGQVDVALPGGASAWALSVVRDVDPAGAQVFDDLASRNPWKRTRCALVPSSPAPTEGWPLNGLRVNQRLASSASVPIGTVTAWVGSSLLFDATGLGLTGQPMEGWAICNGLNGTVDMRGMVPMGATDVPASGAPDRYTGVTQDSTVNQRYGRDSLVLTEANLPPHVHALNMPSGSYWAAAGASANISGGTGNAAQPFPLTTGQNESGTAEPLDMRQPSRAFMFVQRVA